MPALLSATASDGSLPKMDVIRNLANLLADAEPARLSLQAQSTLTDVVSYTFAYEGGDSYLIALWKGGFATNEIEPGTPLTLTVSGLTTTLQPSAHSALWLSGYDVLHSFQQPLDAYVTPTSVVIPNLQIRDYPLLVRLSQIKSTFLPIVLKNPQSSRRTPGNQGIRAILNRVWTGQPKQTPPADLHILDEKSTGSGWSIPLAEIICPTDAHPPRMC